MDRVHEGVHRLSPRGWSMVWGPMGFEYVPLRDPELKRRISFGYFQNGYDHAAKILICALYTTPELLKAVSTVVGNVIHIQSVLT